MDWQAKFTQLYSVIDPMRSFPAGFDFEANVDQLIEDARAHAKTLTQIADADATRIAQEAKRQVALNKLTAAEKAVLGL